MDLSYEIHLERAENELDMAQVAYTITENKKLQEEILLGIFKSEKEKRSEFTYQKIAQANKEPAIESMNNAKIFLRHIGNICRGEIK